MKRKTGKRHTPPKPKASRQGNAPFIDLRSGRASDFAEDDQTEEETSDVHSHSD